jgi:hypothetical protein
VVRGSVFEQSTRAAEAAVLFVTVLLHGAGLFQLGGIEWKTFNSGVRHVDSPAEKEGYWDRNERNGIIRLRW